MARPGKGMTSGELQLGPTLLRLRLGLGLPALRAARLAHLSMRCLRAVEQGFQSPTVRTLGLIAQAYSLKVSEIVRMAENEL